jgi:hypothetical protein
VRWYPRALFTGLAALVVTATTYRVDGGLGPATLLYPFAFITGALSLGAVATGMLLGHWYLIDLGLSIHPLVRLFRYFVLVTAAHVAVLLATVAVLAATPGAGADAVRLLWEHHATLFAARLLSVRRRPRHRHGSSTGRSRSRTRWRRPGSSTSRSSSCWSARCSAGCCCSARRCRSDGLRGAVGAVRDEGTWAGSRTTPIDADVEELSRRLERP